MTEQLGQTGPCTASRHFQQIKENSKNKPPQNDEPFGRSACLLVITYKVNDSPQEQDLEARGL
jgi:hypothetical protein